MLVSFCREPSLKDIEQVVLVHEDVFCLGRVRES